MDRQEMSWDQFVKGWMFLTSQPWGRQYRSDQPEAKIQIELYFKAFRFVNPYIWEAVCEAHASGERWPSITELKNACNATAGFKTEQPKFGHSKIEWSEAPEPIALVMDHANKKGITIREAALAILPGWVKRNLSHEDAERAANFIERAKENFGVRKER